MIGLALAAWPAASGPATIDLANSTWGADLTEQTTVEPLATSLDDMSEMSDINESVSNSSDCGCNHSNTSNSSLPKGFLNTSWENTRIDYSAGRHPDLGDSNFPPLTIGAESGKEDQGEEANKEEDEEDEEDTSKHSALTAEGGNTSSSSSAVAHDSDIGGQDLERAPPPKEDGVFMPRKAGLNRSGWGGIVLALLVAAVLGALFFFSKWLRIPWPLKSRLGARSVNAEMQQLPNLGDWMQGDDDDEDVTIGGPLSGRKRGHSSPAPYRMGETAYHDLSTPR